MPKNAVRDLRKEKYWRRMVRGHGGSGLSIRAWCRKHGEKEAAFHWWRRELARRDAQTAESAFVPVRVVGGAEPTEAGGCIEIEMSGGRRVRVTGRVDRQMLTDVLAVVTSTDSVEPEGRASC